MNKDFLERIPMISYLSSSIIPLFLLMIVLIGWKQKKNVYDAFLKGAKEGFLIVFDISPTILALFLAIDMFRVSGALDFLLKLLHPLAQFFGFPKEVLPIMITKLFSSSAATGFLIDLFKNIGPDSKAGFLSALMLSSTETIVYTLSVYFSYINIKKTRWTLPGAFLCTLAGIIASLVITNFYF